METHETLKSVLVGGYDKESVLQYVELLLETAQGEAGRLKGELSQLRALNLNLTEQNQRLHTQYHELADSVQGISRTMEALMDENKQLTARVGRYRDREEEVTALHREMEAAANDLIQDAQAEAWRVEEESRQTIVEMEARVAALLTATEEEQERIVHLAASRREAVAKELEQELWSLVALARAVGRLGEETENAMSSRVKSAPVRVADNAADKALPVKLTVGDA